MVIKFELLRSSNKVHSNKFGAFGITGWWKVGWMDGCMDGWMHEWMDGL